MQSYMIPLHAELHDNTFLQAEHHNNITLMESYMIIPPHSEINGNTPVTQGS